jgi:hypothetical protein
MTDAKRIAEITEALARDWIASIWQERVNYLLSALTTAQRERDEEKAHHKETWESHQNIRRHRDDLAERLMDQDAKIKTLTAERDAAREALAERIAVVQKQCAHVCRQHHSGGWTCPACGAYGPAARALEE